MRLIATILAALSFAAFAQDSTPPADCATALAAQPESEAGNSVFVEGSPCYTVRGRLYAGRSGDGVEASAIRGDIQRDQLAADIPIGAVPVQVEAVVTRDGRTLSVAGDLPQATTLVVLRTPATVHDTGTDQVRIRAPGGADPGTAATIKTLRGTGGGAVLWSALAANTWYLLLFADDWHLL